MIPQLAFGPGAQVNYREAGLRCEITELIGVRTNQVHETSLSYLSHFPRTSCWRRWLIYLPVAPEFSAERS